MREIKLRVWDTHRKAMYCAQGIRFEEGEVLARWRIPGESCLVEGSVPITQFIGVKDKNGVEIYEGDIIRHQSGKYGTDFEIKWSPILCGFTAMQIKSGHPSPQLNQGTMSYFEVVGNIYENPELVESN